MTTTAEPAMIEQAFDRRSLLALPLLGAGALALSGCSTITGLLPVGSATLTIVSAGWTGWSIEQPDPVTRIFVVAEGDEVADPGGSTRMVFTVVEISRAGLRLRSTESLAPLRPDAFDVDWNTPSVTAFDIPVGEELRMGTPSLDGGTNYTFSVEL